MARTIRSMAAFVLVLGLTTAAHAQLTPYSAGFNGGFGYEYAQPFPNGGFIVDQYGLVHATPYVALTAPVPVPAAPPQVRTRVSRSASNVLVPAQPRYQLPTGSLGGTVGNGGILYSPGTRYGSYGSGYGYGPYGVTNYGYMWKGWPMGY